MDEQSAAATGREPGAGIWARCRPGTADILRRGAWYPVRERTREGGVIVDMGDRHVFLAEAQVYLRSTPPDRWCVVRRSDVFRERTPEGGGVPGRYAVCPACRHRQDMDEGRPAALACARCGVTSAVDYDADG